MKKLLMLTSGLLLLSLSLVWAQVPSGATVSWLAPTAYMDGSTVAAGDLDHYTITWTSTGTGGPSGTLAVAGSSLAAVVPFVCGQANFVVTVTTSTTAKYPGITSGPAGPILLDSKVVCAINPPGALAVQFSGASSK